MFFSVHTRVLLIKVYYTYAKKVTLAKKFLPRGYKGFKSRAYGILDSQEF